ncbi:MAG: efflux RND transporter periplasmic adaptor subunit [Verrucomicrobiae bacterium]|nr:efflux RND transporter periplasmic adaptor subunit [Verrucomicrobiae bacterium]
MKTHFFSFALAAGLAASVSADPITLDPSAIENLQLGFSEVQPQVIGANIRATGAVCLDETKVVEIVPRIAGIIDEDYQTLGAIVKKGDPLFKLESAELAEILTAYVDAEQSMTFAHTALEQEKTLFERQLSSKENVQTRELEFQQAVAEHARALQPLKLLHFNEGTVHQFLHNVGAGNYTSLDVTAPEGGEIIEKSVRRGASVQPDERLYVIAELAELWVDFQVSLRDAGIVKVGQSVSVESSVTRGQTREGKITYVAPLADEASRTVMVRATLPNEDRSWRPGTPVTVNVKAVAVSSAPVLSVPASAIVDFEAGKAVFVRESDTVFLPVPIKTGASDGENTEVISGIEAGQSVVSTNAAQLKGHIEMTEE